MDENEHVVGDQFYCKVELNSFCLKITRKFRRFPARTPSINLELSALAQTLKPGSHIIIDSTGLKVYGKDEWHQDKHGVNARRTWRKLHIVIDEKHQIIAYDITDNSKGDPTTAVDLLDQIEHSFSVVMGDGA